MLNELSKPLNKEEIELRVGTTSPKGFSLLLYKTARTDVKRLNEVCNTLWTNRHFYDDKGLLCCGISVYHEVTSQWIERIDVGTESQTEKEKGSYSDSFKRAGFRWGIGLELYNSPFIWVSWEMDDRKKPKNFYPSNLEIVTYQVVSGKVYLQIVYSGRIVFDNMKHVPMGNIRPKETNKPKDLDIKIYKTPSKQTQEDKKEYWAEFSSICKSLNVEPLEFITDWIGLDMDKKSEVQGAVAKYLKDKNMFGEQLQNYKDNKNNS